MNLKDAINSLVDKTPYSIAAKVTAVNGHFCDVEPMNGDAEIKDVYLQVNESSQGILCIPVIDSKVIVNWLTEDIAYVALFSDIESIQIRGEGKDGLVNVNDLVSKMNAIENDINTLKTVFSTWVTVPSDGGAALKTASASWAGNSLTNTVKSDLENDKVKHG